MSRFPDFAILLAAAAFVAAPAQAGDAGKGEKLFRQCAACHAVGAGARHKLGPELNNIVGRTAGGAGGYNYSRAMAEAGKAGLVWDGKTLDAYLANPRAFIKGTKMAFAGLKKDDDRADMIAYLQSVSAATKPAEAVGPAKEERKKEKVAITAPPPNAVEAEIPKHGVFHLGRRAMDDEIAAWDIDIRPDGGGLPPGEGSVAAGEKIYTEACAVCHGDFGEGRDRWPVLAGGEGTLKAERPEKTVGSYWPYLSTVFDYLRRAMPFGDARSLSDDDVYALTAYLLYLNNIVTDTGFKLSSKNFTSIRLPNEKNFISDNRAKEPHYVRKGEPCMTNCKPAPAKVIMRARVLDVTPETTQDNDRSRGSVD